MRLYLGDTRDRKQEKLRVRYFCLDPNPSRRCHLPTGASVLLDSGAFKDVRRGRLSISDALARQLEYERRNGFVSERIASYDMLIDEQMKGGRQVKARWDERAGWRAVDATIKAAAYLSDRRAELAPRQLILSAQGVTTGQYQACVSEILKFIKPQDCFGLGGWCIVGQRRELAGVFWQTMRSIIPLIAGRGIVDVHIFGLSRVGVMREFALYCQEHGLRISTDTTRFFFELTRGLMLDWETGKSMRAHESKDLTRDWNLVKTNVERAISFYENIETWQPLQGELW